MKQLMIIALLKFVVGLATNICYADSSPPVLEISIDTELQTITMDNLVKHERTIAHVQFTCWLIDKKK